MDGWSPAENDRSSSEGEYLLEPGSGVQTREAEDGATAAVGFGISGIGEGKVVLGRLGPRDDKELRYLHVMWDPGRTELGHDGGASKVGKVMVSRARRQQRAARSLGPTGKDVYGKSPCFCGENGTRGRPGDRQRGIMQGYTMKLHRLGPLTCPFPPQVGED